MTNGIKWSFQRPSNPAIGECTMDLNSGKNYTWNGTSWVEIVDLKLVPSEAVMAPTKEQLEKYPALKKAWEEYIIVRKLVGP